MFLGVFFRYFSNVSLFFHIILGCVIGSSWSFSTLLPRAAFKHEICGQSSCSKLLESVVGEHFTGQFHICSVVQGFIYAKRKIEGSG